MSNFNATPPPQEKLDTLEKIKKHIGETRFTQFDQAMRMGLPITKLESITGKKYSTNRTYSKVWRSEND